MILLLPIIGGVGVGLVCRGRIARLADLRLRLGWVALLALLVQVVLIFAPPGRSAAGHDPLRLALAPTLAVLGAVVVANWWLPGMPLVALGLLANACVIVANGGLMPVSPAAVQRAGVAPSGGRVGMDTSLGERLPGSKDVLLPAEETRLAWLSDWLVSPPIPRRKIFSPGDLLVAAGITVLLVGAMRRPPADAGQERKGTARWSPPFLLSHTA